MYRQIRNAQPVDIEAGRFLAMGQLDVTLPDPFRWCPRDIVWCPRDIVGDGRRSILWLGSLEDEILGRLDLYAGQAR